MQNEYYTQSKIMEIISDYSTYMDSVMNKWEELYAAVSVGVAQYGEEADMPKATGFSNAVEKEAIRKAEATKLWSQRLTDIKYLQDRIYRVTDKKDARVLNLRLDGFSVSDIAAIERRHRSSIHRQLLSIADMIMGNDSDLCNECNR